MPLSLLLTACSVGFPTHDAATRATTDPSATGSADTGLDSGGTDSATDSAVDSGGTVTPWVRFLSPTDGATVSNPVVWTFEGEGVARLSLSADGYDLATWDPAADGWSAVYTFNGVGYAREVVIEGLDSTGSVVTSDTRSLTVEAPGVSLDVPYFYQYDNRYEPSSTCGITSTAMAIDWWRPGQVTPDSLYVDYGKSQGQSPAGIAGIYAGEGLYGMSTTSGTRAQVRQHLDAGRPVVAHGWWTGSGHVTVIVGYDEDDWIVNDPAGDWYTCYGCGPADHVRYPIGGGWDDAMSVDGDLWFSVSDVSPF